MIKLFILFIAFNLSSLNFVQAQSSRALKAKTSLWEIQTESSKRGVGFFISPNLFVTNFRFLSKLLETTENLNEIYLSQKENPNTLSIKKVLIVSALYDLALIEINENSNHYLTLSKRKPNTNDELFIYAHPDQILTEIKKVRQTTYEDDYFSFFSINQSHLSGVNGSPVINNRGQVVGVFSLSITNLASSIKINHLQNFIKGYVGEICNDRTFKICREESLNQLSKDGSLLAQYQMAIIEKEYEKNFAIAFDLFEKLAEQNHIPSLFQLASMHLKGEGTKQNFRKAFELYKNLAEQNHTEAQYQITKFQKMGIIISRKEAFHWMEKAAKKNHILAQSGLAGMYIFGIGTRKNPKMTQYWFKRSAEQGDRDSQYDLGKIYYNKRNYRKAFLWFKRSAMQGHKEAQAELSKLYRTGRGTKKNHRLADYWLSEYNKHTPEISPPIHTPEISPPIQTPEISPPVQTPETLKETPKFSLIQTTRKEIQTYEFSPPVQTPEIETEIKASIWKVYSNSGKDFFIRRGTGFFIRPNLFVTNFQIIDDLLEANEIRLSQKGNPNILSIKQIVAVSTLYDLALLEVKEKSPHYLTLSENEVKSNDELFSIGYPKGIFTKIKKTGDIGYEDSHSFSFPINRLEVEGASGSPILNKQRQVMGILYSSSKKNDRVYAIKVNHLKNLIAGNTGQNCESKIFQNCLGKDIENLINLANQGDQIAQGHLSRMYMWGVGVEKTPELAYYWQQRAIESNCFIERILGFPFCDKRNP